MPVWSVTVLTEVWIGLIGYFGLPYSRGKGLQTRVLISVMPAYLNLCDQYLGPGCSPRD